MEENSDEMFFDDSPTTVADSILMFISIIFKSVLILLVAFVFQRFSSLTLQESILFIIVLYGIDKICKVIEHIAFAIAASSLLPIFSREFTSDIGTFQKGPKRPRK